MLGQNPTTTFASPQAGVANAQPLRLQIALVLLLVALGVVIARNRDFWFGSDETLESDAGSESVVKSDSAPLPALAAQVPATQAAAAKNRVAAKTSTQAATVPSANKTASETSANPESPVVSATRAILPPLDIEVVAGDTHRTLHPGSNVTKVEIPSDSNRISAGTTSETSLPTKAAENERLSTATVPELRQTVDTTYPLLGQHMRVQGSVVLQAVVATDGTIEDLRVLSGPPILSGAAQQAVRQWRFKPVLQNGQPVETKARITVNFSIISDNPSKTS